MKRYVICYSRWGLELEGNTREELINAYLGSIGGPQNAFNHFMNHLSFAEDTSKVIESENKNDDSSRDDCETSAD